MRDHGGSSGNACAGVWEVSNLNTSQDINYLEGFHGFLQILEANAGIIHQIRP
jgi:hypothetical protein